MIGVLTGDIINSRSVENPLTYLGKLKAELSEIGNAGKDWEIYRGDSFQLISDELPTLLELSLIIKAAIKTIESIDVRIGIGIGDINFHASSISESNGEAFIRSGDCLNRIIEEQVNLGISTPWSEKDEKFNLMFKLIAPYTDSWSNRMAESVYYSLKFKNKPQRDIGEMMKIKQNTVSELLSRAKYKELNLLIGYFSKEIRNVTG